MRPVMSSQAPFLSRGSIGIKTAAIAALLLAGTARCAVADLSAPGPFAAGTRTVTVTRPSGSTFSATLHYPATSPGTNAPFDPAAAPCPGITFGHGFLQPVTQYASTLSHLATHGFIVIASQSESGLFPNHANFAKDLRYCLDWLEQQNTAPSSEFFGSIDMDAFGASGHSMGGGAAILAAKDDPRIRALAPTAPANTSPSSIDAMLSVLVASRLIVGGQDSIVPPAGTASPMYANAKGPRQLLSIQGGFHCGFTDGNFIGCDSGSITRAQQLAITRRLLTEFFLLHLRGEQSRWKSVWGPDLPPPGETIVTRDPRVTIDLDASSLSVPAGATAALGALCGNTGPVDVGVEILGEAPLGWSISITPPNAGPLPPGGSAGIELAVTATTEAPGAAAILSARRSDDGATRAFAILTLKAVPPRVPGDLNGDGLVDGDDLGTLLGSWGPCPAPCPADLDGDGVVDGADMGLLLGFWS